MPFQPDPIYPGEAAVWWQAPAEGNNGARTLTATAMLNGQPLEPLYIPMSIGGDGGGGGGGGDEPPRNTPAMIAGIKLEESFLEYYSNVYFDPGEGWYHNWSIPEEDDDAMGAVNPPDNKPYPVPDDWPEFEDYWDTHGQDPMHTDITSISQHHYYLYFEEPAQGFERHWQCHWHKIRLRSPAPLPAGFRKTYIGIREAGMEYWTVETTGEGVFELIIPPGGTESNTLELIAPPTSFPAVGAGSSWSSYSLLSIEVMQPTINADGTIGDLARVQELRMCRWNSPRIANDQVDRAAFADHDPDRIVVRIPVPSKKGSASVKVKVSTRTGSYTPDAGAELDFKAEAPNSEYFVSDSLAIVTDEEDDELTVGNGADNEPGDRTFRGRPGGHLHIECPDLNNATFDIPIKRFTHKVRYQQIFVGMDAAEKTASQACRNENLLRFWQIFAQEHIETIDEDAPIDISEEELEAVVENPAILSIYGLQQVSTLLPSSPHVIKVVWMSQNYSSLPVSLGTAVPSIHGVCFMWLGELNKFAGDVTLYSGSTAHEVGHNLGLALAGDHLQSDGTPYLPYMLMCRGESLGQVGGSNYIDENNPDRSAKHWTLKDGDLMRTDALGFCVPQ